MTAKERQKLRARVSRVVNRNAKTARTFNADLKSAYGYAVDDVRRWIRLELLVEKARQSRGLAPETDRLLKGKW